MSETVEKNAVLPKLRFSQFQGQSAAVVQLSKLAKPVTGGPPTGDPAPVLTLSAEHGIISQDTYFGKRVAGENTDRYTFIERGDFVYNDRITSHSRYGTIRRLHESTNGIVSPIYKCFRFPDEADASFFDFYLQSGKHDSEIRSLINEGARSGRYNLTITQFLSTRVPKFFPAEQRKIAECLQSLDDLIAAQMEKLEGLKRHKKGLLQQLFPNEGENTPRLRFPEFKEAADWETHELGDLVRFRSGSTPSKERSDYWDGDIPWISAESMHALCVTDSNKRITSIAADDGCAIVPKGSLLILVRGMTLFRRIPICISGRDVAFNQDVKSMEPTDIDPHFLLYTLISGAAKIRVDSAGHGTGKINLDELKSTVIAVPGKEEQRVIGNLLVCLEESIESSLNVADQLRTHKAALMQQLFPNIAGLGL